MHVAVVLRSAPHLATHEGLSVDNERTSPVLLWPQDVSRQRKLLEQRSTLLLLQRALRWPRASWSVGTSRLRHACTDRPVSMSGGALRL